MGAVAAQAARRERAVRRLCFVGMAIRAGFLALPAVRLVTIRAGLVPGGSRSMLLFVAVGARAHLGAGVRLVTLSAARMTAGDAPVFTRVTLFAADLVGLGMVR